MQIGGVLITHNANTHPPETWAAATASMIFSVGNDVAGILKVAALLFQAKLAELLVPHHAKLQQDEQAKLDADAERMHAPHEDAADGLDQVVADIRALAAGSPWEKDFAAPEMERKIRQLVGDHFATAQHIHRMAHALANPGLAASQRLIARFHGKA